jgi:hypothetical protein
MRVYGGVDVKVHVFLTSALVEGYKVIMEYLQTQANQLEAL